MHAAISSDNVELHRTSAHQIQRRSKIARVFESLRLIRFLATRGIRAQPSLVATDVYPTVAQTLSQVEDPPLSRGLDITRLSTWSVPATTYLSVQSLTDTRSYIGRSPTLATAFSLLSVPTRTLGRTSRRRLALRESCRLVVGSSQLQ